MTRIFCLPTKRDESLHTRRGAAATNHTLSSIEWTRGTGRGGDALLGPLPARAPGGGADAGEVPPSLHLWAAPQQEPSHAPGQNPPPPLPDRRTGPPQM